MNIRVALLIDMYARRMLSLVALLAIKCAIPIVQARFVLWLRVSIAFLSVLLRMRTRRFAWRCSGSAHFIGILAYRVVRCHGALRAIL